MRTNIKEALTIGLIFGFISACDVNVNQGAKDSSQDGSPDTSSPVVERSPGQDDGDAPSAPVMAITPIKTLHTDGEQQLCALDYANISYIEHQVRTDDELCLDFVSPYNHQHTYNCHVIFNNYAGWGRFDLSGPSGWDYHLQMSVHDQNGDPVTCDLHINGAWDVTSEQLL